MSEERRWGMDGLRYRTGGRRHTRRRSRRGFAGAGGGGAAAARGGGRQRGRYRRRLIRRRIAGKTALRFGEGIAEKGEAAHRSRLSGTAAGGVSVSDLSYTHGAGPHQGRTAGKIPLRFDGRHDGTRHDTGFRDGGSHSGGGYPDRGHGGILQRYPYGAASALRAVAE